MPSKLDADATFGEKLLRLFRKLMVDGRKHFQADLAKEFQCSPQTIIRLTSEIERVVGIALETGIENRKKWYQIKSLTRSHLGLDFEELRYLAICRDLAEAILPQEILDRVEKTLFDLSVLMIDKDFDTRQKAQAKQFSFFSKGKIDYSPFLAFIDTVRIAIEHKKFCLIRYKPAGLEEREFRFAPSKIISMNNALYLLGADLSDNFKEVIKFRNLPIHRFRDVILLERRFNIEFPAVAPNTFGLAWHEPRTYKIKFSDPKIADYIRERTWASEQSIEDCEDGSIILTITTCSEPELLSWVRSFGDGAVWLR